MPVNVLRRVVDEFEARFGGDSAGTIYAGLAVGVGGGYVIGNAVWGFTAAALAATAPAWIATAGAALACAAVLGISATALYLLTRRLNSDFVMGAATGLGATAVAAVMLGVIFTGVDAAKALFAARPVASVMANIAKPAVFAAA